MAKKKVKKKEAPPQKVSLYTLKLSDIQFKRLQKILEARNWADYEVPYARYAYRSEGINLVAYQSGKLVIQGKKTEEFVQYVIEAEITKEARLGYDEVHHSEWFEPHAGLDEAGKGDVFGPLITACVIADRNMIVRWREAGVKDSKSISDKTILQKDQLIRNTPGVVVESVGSTMERYNEMMAKPKANLNLLLAWMHAKGLEKALARKSVTWGMLDQFSRQPLVQRYGKFPNGFDLRMQTKAESDPVVAAASIVARAEYVRRMEQLSENFGEVLKKGASEQVRKQAEALYKKEGEAGLRKYTKMHFKTIRLLQ